MAPELTWRTPILEVLDDVLTADECAGLIARVEAAGPEPALVHNRFGASYRPDYRHNDRVMEDDEVLARLLYRRVEHLVPPDLQGWGPVGANERLRFYRYRPGHFFAPHRDGCFSRSDHEVSLLTLIVYLNGGVSGGETRFLDLGRDVIPRAGRAVLFNHALIHEGREVKGGVKYAVRTDVMYRPLGRRADAA
ncbi:MAG: 2OG-Fe(II) oxygenase [Myxococcaceae bacterium]|nr:2OG-Fe(II) oxygenase [Myxococcaceae bacterium]